MFELLGESGGNVLGLRVAGVIDRDDYAGLVPRLEELIRKEGEIRVLIDMQGFKSESPDAWRADLRFGRKFHRQITKMAIVGDKRWQKWMTAFCAPFYAREARFFHGADAGAAWEWLRE